MRELNKFLKENVDFKNYISGVGYPGVLVDGNTYTGSYYDTVMSSAYTDSLGINPSDIICLKIIVYTH